MIQNLKKSKAGFTLVELIVVIAILGVLAAVLVPQYIQYVESSREGVDRSTLSEIFHACEIEAASRENLAAGDILTLHFDSSTGALTYGGSFATNVGNVCPAVNSAMKSASGKGLTPGLATVVITISYDTNGVYWKQANAPSIGGTAVAGTAHA